MAFDFKKEYKEFYLPPSKPGIVEIPGMNYLAVRGQGDPNAEDSDYKASIGLLYGVAFTLKMSWRSGHPIEGYFDYVVPPLEGFWWQEGRVGIDYAHKEDFRFLSVIRLPDFVTEEDFLWARAEAAAKKGADFSRVEFLPLEEGLCVQMLHVGPYDDEPVSIARMEDYLRQQGFRPDFSETRLHHEIYLSDARKVPPERRRTVLRHPIARL